jgi:hypothetical protein
LDFFALLHVVKVEHISGVFCTVGGALVIVLLFGRSRLGGGVVLHRK